MSWSYSNDPSGSTRDAVRFLVGQTSTGDPVLISNEEIAWLLTEEPNVYYAAASACQGLASRYSGMVTEKTVGDLSLRYGERATEYTTRAASLRLRGAMRNTIPFAGGVDLTDFEQRAEDTTIVQPVFSIGRDDRPDTNANAIDAST